jgi:hypothetical protein
MRAALLAIVMVVIPFCRSDQFDLDGDGTVTITEVFDTLVESICGGELATPGDTPTSGEPIIDGSSSMN